MKIQKHLSKKRGDKTYYKYVIVLKEEILKKAGFKAGDELKAEVRRGEVRLGKE